MPKPESYALRMPASLKRAAQETAKADGTTLNQFIVTAVAEKLSALRTAEYFAERAALRFLSRPGGMPPAPGDEMPDDLRRD